MTPDSSFSPQQPSGLRCKPDHPPCFETPDGCQCSQDKIQMPHRVTRLCEVCLTHPLTSSSTSLPPCGQLLRLLSARNTHDPWLLFLICTLSVPLSLAQRPCPPPKLDLPSSVSLCYTSQSTPHSWHHVNILSFPCSLLWSEVCPHRPIPMLKS